MKKKRSSNALGKGLTALINDDRGGDIDLDKKTISREFYGSLIKKYVQSGKDDPVLEQLIEDVRDHLNISIEEHEHLINTLKKRETLKPHREMDNGEWKDLQKGIQNDLNTMFDEFRSSSGKGEVGKKGDREAIPLPERAPKVVKGGDDRPIKAPAKVRPLRKIRTVPRGPVPGDKKEHERSHREKGHHEKMVKVSFDDDVKRPAGPRTGSKDHHKKETGRGVGTEFEERAERKSRTEVLFDEDEEKRGDQKIRADREEGGEERETMETPPVGKGRMERSPEVRPDSLKERTEVDEPLRMKPPTRRELASDEPIPVEGIHEEEEEIGLAVPVGPPGGYEEEVPEMESGEKEISLEDAEREIRDLEQARLSDLESLETPEYEEEPEGEVPEAEEEPLEEEEDIPEAEEEPLEEEEVTPPPAKKEYWKENRSENKRELKMLMDEGRLEEALELSALLSDFYPEDLEVLNERGVLLYHTGRVDEAIDIYDKVLRIDPNHIEGMINYATLLAGRGDIDQSLDILDRAISKDPYSEDAWNNKAVVLAHIGRNRDALNCLDESLRINEDSVETWLNTAVIMERMGEVSPASDCYRRVLELDPENETASKGLDYCRGML